MAPSTGLTKNSNTPTKISKTTRFKIAMTQFSKSILRVIIHLKIFFKRTFSFCYIHSTFRSFVIPVFFGLATFVIGRFIFDDLIVIVLTIFAVLLSLKFVQSLSGIVFRKHLKPYVTLLDRLHPVTQKFGSELTGRYIKYFRDKKEEKFINLDIFVRNRKICLLNLLEELEDAGIYLKEDEYELLLSSTSALDPGTFLAIWDTDQIKITESVAKTYLNCLEKQYKTQLERNKRRIFVFKDKNAYMQTINHNVDWPPLLKKHFSSFGFKKVHYCYKSDFNRVIASHQNATKKVTDFILCSLSTLVGRFRWLIGVGVNKDETKKTYLVSDREIRSEIDSTFAFYKDLLKDSDKNKRYFLPNHNGGYNGSINY